MHRSFDAPGGLRCRAAPTAQAAASRQRNVPGDELLGVLGKIVVGIDEFTDENGGGPGVRLCKRIHKKPSK
jgi:hypothetical protein